ncbi:DMT family transporter [Algihabitans albus]|uniref:DMT family transporter n=1 Tax=Algihabitans albus TaxID=2164067 RepID=UPI000E5D576F|nr:DMT family transporter [Algihabitans albus]
MSHVRDGVRASAPVAGERLGGSLAVPCALAAIGFWSTNAVVAKYALVELSVPQVQALQFAGATFALWLFGFGLPRKRVTWPAPRALALGALGLVGTMVFQYVAFAVGPIATVNLIAYSWPLLTALIVAAVGVAYRPLRLVITSAAGFVGVGLLIGGDAALLQGGGSLGGYAAAFASAICMAVYTVLIGRYSVSASSLLLAAALIGLIGTSAWWLLTGAGVPSVPYILLGLYLGIGPMGVGYLLWSLALRRGAAGSISTLGYATPVLSTVLLYISGEAVTWGAVVGGLIIIVCCVLVGTGKLEQRSDVKPA